MFSEGLSVDFHASEGATVRSSGEAAGLRNSIRQHSQRCLAGPNAIILAEEQATRKRILAGITEAVFSSSGDRIRAIQATAATAGPSIASTDRPSWASRVYVRLAEKLFAVLLSSDCRICGEPPVKIPRLPVCQECLDGMQRTRGECVRFAASVFFLLMRCRRIKIKVRARRCADCAGASNRLLCARRLMAASMADCGSGFICRDKCRWCRRRTFWDACRLS
jgi:hypothetical protein